MEEQDLIKQALRDFVATSNSGKYKTESELLSKFPELSSYDKGALRDFVATSNSGKYKSEDEVFSKFPEFSNVKKKEPSTSLGYEKPSEALRMGGLPKQEKLSQSPLKTAETTTPSVSIKRPSLEFTTEKPASTFAVDNKDLALTVGSREARKQLLGQVRDGILGVVEKYPETYLSQKEKTTLYGEKKIPAGTPNVENISKAVDEYAEKIKRESGRELDDYGKEFILKSVVESLAEKKTVGQAAARVDIDLVKEKKLPMYALTGIKSPKGEVVKESIFNEEIKQAALEKEKVLSNFQKTPNKKLDAEFAPELNTFKAEVKLESSILNNQIQSEYKQEFDAALAPLQLQYQVLVDSRQMTPEQANAEFKQKQEQISGEIQQNLNLKFKPEFDALNNKASVKTKEIQTRYNRKYQAEFDRLQEQQNDKIKAVQKKYDGIVSKEYFDEYSARLGQKIGEVKSENLQKELANFRNLPTKAKLEKALMAGWNDVLSTVGGAIGYTGLDASEINKAALQTGLYNPLPAAAFENMSLRDMLTDSDWWIVNGVRSVPFTVVTMPVGIGGGILSGTLAKALGAAKRAQVISSVVGGGVIGWEAERFLETGIAFKEAIDAGKSVGEASEIAASSANLQFATLPLNIAQMLPFFGKGFKFLNSSLLEGFSGGIEEIIQGWAGQRAKNLQEGTEQNGFGQAVNSFGNYFFSKPAMQEGAIGFAVGQTMAVGSMLNTTPDIDKQIQTIMSSLAVGGETQARKVLDLMKKNGAISDVEFTEYNSLIDYTLEGIASTETIPVSDDIKASLVNKYVGIFKARALMTEDENDLASQAAKELIAEKEKEIKEILKGTAPVYLIFPQGSDIPIVSTKEQVEQILLKNPNALNLFDIKSMNDQVTQAKIDEAKDLLNKKQQEEETTTDGEGTIEGAVSTGTNVAQEGLGVANEPSGEGVTGEDIQAEKVLVPRNFKEETITEAIDNERGYLEKEILSEEQYIAERKNKKSKFRKILDKLSGVTYDKYLISQQNRLSLLNENPLAYFEKELADEKKWQEKHPEDASENLINYLTEVVDNFKSREQAEAVPQAPGTPQAGSVGVGGDVEFGTAFNMQEATAENTVGKEKDLWGKAQVWRERIENAGDILRELSSRGDKPDVGYLMEKVKKLRDWIAQSKKGYTPIDKSIKTIEDFEKTSLRWSDAVDSREYIEKFHSSVLDKIRSEYEAIPTYTKEQRLAVELVLDLINNNIKGLESKLNEIENISNQIKTNGKLPIIADIKLGKAVEQSLKETPTAETKPTTKPVAEQIADLRAAEKAEYSAMADPKDKAKREKIYNKYDKLITPLIEEQKATEAAKVEPVQEDVEVVEEKQYEPITVGDTSHDSFTRDNAVDYEEDEKEGDNGRTYTYLSSVTVELVDDVSGETIGRMSKLKSEDGEITYSAEDIDGNQVAEEVATKAEAQRAIVDQWNKQQEKEFKKEKAKEAKEKAKEAAAAKKKAEKEAEKAAKNKPKAGEDLDNKNNNINSQDEKQTILQSTGDGRGRTGSGEITPLEGTPTIQGATGPNPQLVAVAEQYAKDNGIDLKRQGEYVEVDEERAKRIADAYEQMANDPQNPKVKEAYQNLIKQTKAQYEALVKAGYKFWFLDLNIPSNQDYAVSPYNAMRDLRSNKEMGVFPTTDGFGTNEFDVENNPMLEDTGIKWPVGGMDGKTKPVLANDLFRAVHDAFGHGLEGAGFRARGEENAWQAHSRLYTGSAVGAITTETRGQNSWVNFGPQGEANRKASAEDTVFADQKIGLMPEFTWTEGRASDMPAAKEPAKPKAKKSKPEQIGDGLLDALGLAPVEPAKKAGKAKPVNVSNKSELAELEDQAEGNKKSIIEAAKKGIATLRSVFPDMEIYIHEDPESYNETMSEVGGVANSRGNFAFERDANDNPTGRGRIDINLSNAKDTTVAHELTHAVLLKAFGDNPALFKAFRDRMSTILRADLNEQVTAFEKLYAGQDVAPEEYLTELAALLSQGGETVEYKPSTLRRVAALINEFVSRITKGKFQPFKSEVDFKNFVDFLNQVSGAIRVGDVINNLNDKEAYSSGASIPVSNFESFVAKKVSEPVKSKSQIGDYKFPDSIKILKTADLPVKNLTDLVKQYEGKVVIITSDATGYGVDKNGDPIFGGFGFSANAKNVNNGIGFASVSIGTVKGTYTAAEKAYGEGKALVLVMIQPPHTTINNSYGSKYIIRGIKEIASQSKEELVKTKEAIKEFIKNSTAIQNELKTNEASLKRGSENKLIELIDNIDENTDLDTAVDEFIADTTFTIRKELGKGIILENKDIRTNKSTNYAKIALNNAGYNIFGFLKEYGDNTFLSDDIILNNTGGFVVGGFELDILPTEQREKLINNIQSKGIVHPLFNAKLPGANHFRLDGLYDVQENFSEYVRPETIINLDQKERDKLVRKYYTEDKFYSAQYRSIPLSKRTYTQLTVPSKTEFKEKYLRGKGALVETIPNIATKVAKGEGFIPKPGAAEQMAEATMVSKPKDATSAISEYSEAPPAKKQNLKSKAQVAVSEETGFVPVSFWVEQLKGNVGYLDDVIKHILNARQELKEGKVTENKVAKAYLITLGSMGSGGGWYSSWKDKTKQTISDIFLEKKNGKDWIRPEGAAAAYLVTPEGKKLVKDIIAGNATQEQIKDLFSYIGFGRENSKSEYVVKTIARGDIKAITDLFNKNKGRDFAELYQGAMKLEGIGEGKTGFFNQYFGVSERGVIDARELNAWVAGSMKLTPEQKERVKKAASSKKLGDQLLGYIEQVGIELGYPKDLAGYIAHHAIWDGIANSVTTHAGEYSVVSKSQKAQTDKIKEFIDAQRKSGQSEKDIKAGLELVADKVGLTAEDINNLMGVESDEAKPLKGFKPKEKPTEEPEGEKTGTRAFATKSFERAGVPIEDIPNALKSYVPTSVEKEEKIAEDFIRKHGIDNTINQLKFEKSGIHPKNKPVLARVLLNILYAEQNAELAKNTTDEAVLEKIAKDVYDVIDSTLTAATEAAQFLSLMRDFYNSNPYNFLMQVTRLIEKNINDPIKADVSEAVVIINNANQAAAGQVASNVVKEVVTPKVTSAKEKFERSKANLKALWKKSFNVGISANQYEAAKNDIQFAKALTIMAKDFVVYQSVQFSEFLKEVASQIGLQESDIDQDHLRKIFEKAKSEQIQAGIKVGLKELELKLKDLIESHYSSNEIEEKLIDKLKKEFGIGSDFGFNDAAIKELEAAIKREIKVLTAKEKIKALNAAGIKGKQDIDLILGFSEEGLLEDSVILEKLGEKLGIKKLTAAEAKKLGDIAKDINDSKEDVVKARNVQRFEDFKFVLSKKYNITDFLISNYLTNIFGSLASNLKNIASNVTETSGLVGELLGNALISGNPKDVQRALQALTEGSIRGFDFTKEVLSTGVASYRDLSQIRARGMWELIMDREFDLTNTEKFLQFMFKNIPYLGPTALAERRIWNRFLLAGDAFSSTTNSEIGSLIAATREADKRRLRGNERTNFIAEQMANSPAAKAEAREYALSLGYKEGTKAFRRAMSNYLVSKRPEAIKRFAAEYSGRATLTQQPPTDTFTGLVASILNDITAKKPILKLYLPVVNTFANLIIKNLERSPFEFLLLGFDYARKDIKTQEGAKAGLTKEQVARRVKTATVFTAIGVLLFIATGGTGDDEEGVQIYGSGTGDPALDKARRDLGWRPNTIRFSKDGGYFNFEYLPIGFLLGMVGNMRDYFRYRNKPVFKVRQAQSKRLFDKNLDELTESERTALEIELTMSGNYNLPNEENKEIANMAQELALSPVTYSFQLLKSLGELVNGLSDGAGFIKTGLRSGANIARGVAAPRYLGEVRDIFDNNLYDSKEFRNVIGANIPFITLGGVKLDAFGREIKKYQAESMFSGLKYMITRGFYNPPVINEIDQFLWENRIAVSVPSNPASVNYTDEVLRDYIVLRGSLLLDKIGKAMNERKFTDKKTNLQFTPQQTLDIINDYIRESNEEAQKTIDKQLGKAKKL